MLPNAGNWSLQHVIVDRQVKQYTTWYESAPLELTLTVTVATIEYLNNLGIFF